MARAKELFDRINREGEAAIDALIADYQAENLWLEFKRSADNGSGTKLHQSDRENLAKATSGFANSDGGVIVWGVDCRTDKSGADLPSARHPIREPHRFAAWLENAISSCVTPAAPSVENVALLLNDEHLGFVATLIPPSNMAPHQCLQPPGRLQYYMRAGSSFLPVPHSVLAGMFGRRPQPQLLSFYEAQVRLMDDRVLDINLGVGVVNQGAAPVGDAYVSARILVPPNCHVSFKPRSPEAWVANQAYGCYFSVTSKTDFRLAPHIPVLPMRFQLQFAPPFPRPYVFDVNLGCDGAVPQHNQVVLSPVELESAYNESVAIIKTCASSEDVTKQVLTWLVDTLPRPNSC